MEYNRIFEILKSKEKSNILYDERPVWIQELNNNIAKVSFIDNFDEKDVHIEDLYEDNLYEEENEKKYPGK